MGRAKIIHVSHPLWFNSPRDIKLMECHKTEKIRNYRLSRNFQKKVLTWKILWLCAGTVSYVFSHSTNVLYICAIIEKNDRIFVQPFSWPRCIKKWAEKWPEKSVYQFAYLSDQHPVLNLISQVCREIKLDYKHDSSGRLDLFAVARLRVTDAGGRRHIENTEENKNQLYNLQTTLKRCVLCAVPTVVNHKNTV